MDYGLIFSIGNQSEGQMDFPSTLFSYKSGEITVNYKTKQCCSQTETM